MINCLHIANDFSLTKVHKNLYSNLDILGVGQTVFNPIRKNTPIGNNKITFQQPKSEIIYSKMLKKYHRIFFRNKINFLYQDLIKKCNPTEIDIIHATTLFSDGAVALKIYKAYKIPYIVAIRGTDVSLFLKYRPDLYFLLKDILINASYIIFMGEALKRQFFKKKFVKLLEPKLKDKIKIIHNGVDNFWLSNINNKKFNSAKRILYIGRFDKNKNTLNLIKAILSLRKELPDIKLDLVGKGGVNEQEVITLSQKYKNLINFYGPIYDNKELQKIYLANDIFAMPSLSETFGLVYIEALTQGLPILCSKNQGVDGAFPIQVGRYVNPKSIDSIKKNIKEMIMNYETYELTKIDFTQFHWNSIAKTYLKLYKKVCKK